MAPQVSVQGRGVAAVYRVLAMLVSAAVLKRPNAINNIRAATVLSILSTANTASEGAVAEGKSKH